MKNKDYFEMTQEATTEGMQDAISELIRRNGSPVPIDIFKKYKDVDEELWDNVADLAARQAHRDYFKGTRDLVRQHAEAVLKQIIEDEPAFITGHTFKLSEGDIDTIMDSLYSGEDNGE